MTLWSRAFQEEIGEPADEDIELRIDKAMAARHLWLWDRSGETVSMAAARDPVQGVVRIAGVYTPPKSESTVTPRRAFTLSRKSCATLAAAALSTRIWEIAHRTPSIAESDIARSRRFFVIDLSETRDLPATLVREGGHYHARRVPMMGVDSNRLTTSV